MSSEFTKFHKLAAATLLIVGASFFVGVYVGENHSGVSRISQDLEKTDQPLSAPADFSPFWHAWELVDQKFVSTGTSTIHKDINQDRVWGAIRGMVESLGDPYTTFFPPEESSIFESDISGNFGGVGLEIGVKDNVPVVISPLKGTPGYRAGIKSGDFILKIDDLSTERLSVDEAVKHIRGDIGTTVKLTLVRPGEKEPFVVTLTRAAIDIPTIETELRADNIFVIRLYNFSAISSNLFRGALREFVRSGSNKLILDLRGNPGGYLEAAVDMASWFLPPGAVIVKEDYKDNKDAVLHRSKGYNIFGPKLSMVILIDGGSASASEILAGALKENGIATLVGTHSFGKGSVQELIKLTPDTSLKVTIARWLTPKGNSISNGGLTPDVVVEIPTKDTAKAGDVQLKKAVEILLKK